MSQESRELLTHFSINNFMSIQEATISLQPLTVFIGANNSGKSNFFRALEYLSICTHQAPVPPQFLNWSRLIFNFDTQRSIRLKAEFAPRQGYQDFIQLINPLNHGEPPRIEYYPSRQQPDGLLSRPAFSVAYFNINIEKIISQNTVTPNPKIEWDGSNITAVLDWLRGEQPHVFATIEQELQHCIPEVEHIILKTVGSGQKQLGIQQKGCLKPFIGSEVSEGVLTFIALLTIIHQPDPPTIICLEEPENHIHPRRLRNIIDYLTDLAYHNPNPTQIFISTHSPYIIDIFKKRLNEVIIVEKPDNQTIFTPLTRYEKVISLDDDLSLGELWFSSLLGGVPKP